MKNVTKIAKKSAGLSQKMFDLSTYAKMHFRNP